MIDILELFSQGIIIRKYIMSKNKITYKQLKEILNQGGYFLFRYYWGGVMAVNAKVGLLSEKRKDYEPNSKTPFVSYRKCSIDEYVCNKKLEYGVR